MKIDLDMLMEKRGLDAFVVACDDHPNAPRDYLTGGAAITSGLIMKKRGALPVLFANPMEVEEAAKSGLTVYSFDELGWAQLVKEMDGDRVKAEVVFWGRCFEKIGLAGGKVGIYGVSHLNIVLELVRLLAEAYPQFTFAGEMGLTLFDEAYVTKDTNELARLRSVAQRTSMVLQQTWDFISGHRAVGELVVKVDGAPLTIGDVKRFVRHALLDVGLEDAHMIFAQGRDGGIPHSRGEDGQALQLGQAVVFDLFPHELGGGYYHDCTRTWSIGYAAPEVIETHRQVQEAFDLALDSLRIGMPTRALQEAVQTYFESKGHPTARSQPGTTTGYVHSLGHGLGLNIHERPSIGHLAKDTFAAGNVITIEPGLYYPDQGFGVRLEDTVYLNPNGEIETLTAFHKELVLPLMG